MQLARQEATDPGGVLYLHVTVIVAKTPYRVIIMPESFGLFLPINGNYLSDTVC